MPSAGVQRPLRESLAGGNEAAGGRKLQKSLAEGIPLAALSFPVAKGIVSPSAVR